MAQLALFRQHHNTKIYLQSSPNVSFIPCNAHTFHELITILRPLRKGKALLFLELQFLHVGCSVILTYINFFFVLSLHAAVRLRFDVFGGCTTRVSAALVLLLLLFLFHRWRRVGFLLNLLPLFRGLEFCLDGFEEGYLGLGDGWFEELRRELSYY